MAKNQQPASKAGPEAQAADPAAAPENQPAAEELFPAGGGRATQAAGYTVVSPILKDGKSYGPGDAIELSEAEAEAMPWAVQKTGGR